MFKPNIFRKPSDEETIKRHADEIAEHELGKSVLEILTSADDPQVAELNRHIAKTQFVYKMLGFYSNVSVDTAYFEDFCNRFARSEDNGIDSCSTAVPITE